MILLTCTWPQSLSLNKETQMCIFNVIPNQACLRAWGLTINMKDFHHCMFSYSAKEVSFNHFKIGWKSHQNDCQITTALSPLWPCDILHLYSICSGHKINVKWDSCFQQQINDNIEYRFNCSHNSMPPGERKKLVQCCY